MVQLVLFCVILLKAVEPIDKVKCVWLRQERTEQWALTFKGTPVSAVYHPFYLLVTVLREPVLAILSHVIQDEL